MFRLAGVIDRGKALLHHDLGLRQIVTTAMLVVFVPGIYYLFGYLQSPSKSDFTTLKNFRKVRQLSIQFCAKSAKHFSISL
jgi:hypothetical protein